jgi:hypothetical protein
MATTDAAPVMPATDEPVQLAKTSAQTGGDVISPLDMSSEEAAVEPEAPTKEAPPEGASPARAAPSAAVSVA